MREHRFPYLWNLADGYPAEGIESHGCKVFGTFLCGGGSSMGYKLAGYHHMGGVEIDPKVADIYRQNHNPELLYVEDLRLFNERTDLPDELYLPRIELVFTEKPIFFKEVMDKTDVTPDLTELGWLLFNNKRKSDHSLGDTSRRVRNKYSQFTQSWYHSDEVCPTLTTNYGILYDFPRPLNEREIKLCSAFPLDYKVPTREKMLWLAGMSVPPVMMAQISYQIYVQWLKNM